MESLAFSLFSGPVQDKFNELCNHPGELFIVDISSFEVWDKYLNAYPEEVNGIFREGTQRNGSGYLVKISFTDTAYNSIRLEGNCYLFNTKTFILPKS